MFQYKDSKEGIILHLSLLLIFWVEQIDNEGNQFCSFGHAHRIM